MPIISDATPEEIVWQKISEVYGSPHVDNAKEREKGLEQLRQALRTGVSVDLLLNKARQAATAHGKMLTKVSALLISQYWLQTFTQNVVQASGYRPPGPWQGKALGSELPPP